jgi:hypothetical protein
MVTDFQHEALRPRGPTGTFQASARLGQSRRVSIFFCAATPFHPLVASTTTSPSTYIPLTRTPPRAHTDTQAQARSSRRDPIREQRPSHPTRSAPAAAAAGSTATRGTSTGAGLLGFSSPFACARSRRWLGWDLVQLRFVRYTAWMVMTLYVLILRGWYTLHLRCLRLL